MIESLELRTLLSAVLTPSMMTTSSSRHDAPIHAAQGPPVIHDTSKLHLVAGAAFTGQLGFYASPVLDPPDGYFASIDWGDGNASAATLQYGVQGSTGGYQIVGSHTYAKPGQFKIEITFTSGPIPEPGQPTPNFLQLIETIIRKVIVAKAYENSGGGVSIGEVADQSFTADLGSFSTTAPASHLHTTISWGDGVSSKGTLNPTGVTGLDVLQFSVSGTHTYAQSGTYPVHIVVTRSGTGMTGAHITSILSTATVTSASSVIALAGTINGTYITPAASPEAGTEYVFTGSGTTGALGDVTVSGNVTVPASGTSGTATGSLTLTNAQGSVTLQLTGTVELTDSQRPAAVASSPIAPTVAGGGPSTLAYVIDQATGVYAGDTASGTITATLTPGTSAAEANRFNFVFA